jgi:uncharacterized integral membrane protein
VSRSPEPEVAAARSGVATRAGAAIWNRLSRHGVDVIVSLAAIAVVSAPLLGRSTQPLDFANYLWLAWAAGKGFIAAGHPVLFTNTGADGAFYPIFAFYGGTLFAATGLLGELLGGQILVAYTAVCVLAIAAVYLGTLSLARQLGVRGLIAHAPAICAITSAYYVTIIYARGDWPEFVAVSSIPPLVASALHLARAERMRAGSLLVFLLSAVILTGSHNLTLLWAVSFGSVTALGLWLCFGRPTRLPYGRLASLGALAVAALCVNGWFLVIDLTHGSDVTLGAITTFQSGSNAIFDSLGVLLNPFRDAPAALSNGDPLFHYLRGFYVNAPMWFLAWGVIGGAVLLWRRAAPGQLRRIWLFAILLVCLTVFVVADPWWARVPYPWAETQLPFRIDSYLTFAIVGVVIVAAVALERADPLAVGHRMRQGLRIALALAAAVSVGLCLGQEWGKRPDAAYYVRPGPELVSVNTLPRSWYAAADYGDASAPIVQVAQGRIMWIPWTKVRGDYFSGWVSAPPGPTPIETDIFGGDYVVQIGGMQLLGRVSTGQAVVGRLTNGSKVHVVVRTAPSRSIVFGRILSVLGIAVLLAVLASTALGVRLVDVRRLLGRVARRARFAGDH